jgi:hypothetical protein
MTALIIAIIPTLVLGAVLAEVLRERRRAEEQWTRERQLLLNRIKPETAQYIPTEAPQPVPAAIGMDQDDQYWMDQGMSREDLAKAMMAQEVAERPE